MLGIYDNAHLNVVAQDDRALESVVAANATYSRETARVKAPAGGSLFRRRHQHLRIDALIPPGVSGALNVTVRARYTEGGELRQGTYRREVTAA